MLINYIIHRLKWSYRKNTPDIEALIRRGYPDFVFDSTPKSLKNEIPVFVFHSVKAEKLEEQLEFLYKNGYQTLSADEFYEVITCSKPVLEQVVLLTFDDGRGSLWTVAYPLLKKYGFQAVSFIIPGCIDEDTNCSPNLEDVWAGRISLHQIENRDFGSNPLCNWEEIRQMHASGIIDFQSHTMYHSLIFTSQRVVDFINPAFDFYLFSNINVPVFTVNGMDNVKREAEWGTPIYDSEPRMSPRRRYFDDEELRNRCIEYVKERGGADFFNTPGWRKELYKYFRKTRNQLSSKGYFETAEHQREAIFKDLYDSKILIEKKLPGKTVNHLCYPWFIGSGLAVEMSKKAGYLSNFWGIMFGRRSTRLEHNPYRIIRLEDKYLLRLPGTGRRSLREILGEKFLENYPKLVKNLHF
ncbi:polysaccharide deacetylase [candidate division KSB1 bacterium]|nr:MAG: polysaccharide deacetylase [candidate division KSB1 bacterium]